MLGYVRYLKYVLITNEDAIGFVRRSRMGAALDLITL